MNIDIVINLYYASIYSYFTYDILAWGYSVSCLYTRLELRIPIQTSNFSILFYKNGDGSSNDGSR